MLFRSFVLIVALAGTSLSTAIATAQSIDNTARVRCDETDESVILLVGDRPLLRYNKTLQKAPDGLNPLYARSGYVHPIHAPSGRIVSGDFPPDHAHQHALFSAWTRTTYHGKKVDFWNQLGGTGAVGFAGHSAIKNTADYAEFSVKQNHQALKLGDDPVTILVETWTVRASQKDNSLDQGFYVFDLHLSQVNVTDLPLTINHYHYGGMGFRGNNDWFTQEGFQSLKNLKADAAGKADYPPMEMTRHQFLTSEGKRRLEGNHTRPVWVDISGLTDGELAGIAVMGHPNNVRHPHPVRLHPSKPYFAISPCVIGEFEIGPGQMHEARYRYVVHDGAPDAKLLDRLYSQYAQMP